MLDDKEAGANRRHTDSVFTKLFSDKRILLELYNALKGTSYGIDTEIRMANLDNVLFMGRKNDIAFIMEGRIVVLIEHQSTLNWNMPLRMLIYATKIYEILAGPKGLFRTDMMKSPRPEFIVLYNGEDEFPDRHVMKLSDMYVEPCDECIGTLDLPVKVFNINKGHNEELASRSENLRGYEIFVYLVRGYVKAGMDRDSALKQAVDDCIRQNVLKKFLEENSAEVRNMIFGEWDIEVAKEVWLEEGEVRNSKRTARTMLKDGLDLALIARYTKLPEKEILALR
jgi:predicted transposase YdaD